MNISLENSGLTVTVNGTGSNDMAVLQAVNTLVTALQDYRDVSVNISTKPVDIISLFPNDFHPYLNDTVSWNTDIIQVSLDGVTFADQDTMISTR